MPILNVESSRQCQVSDDVQKGSLMDNSDLVEDKFAREDDHDGDYQDRQRRRRRRVERNKL